MQVIEETTTATIQQMVPFEFDNGGKQLKRAGSNNFPFIDLSPQDFAQKAINNDNGEEDSKKRRRILLAPFQTKILKKVLQKTAFPSIKVRNNLSKLLNVPSRNIQIWFQNQRQKAKQKLSDDDENGCCSPKDRKRMIDSLELLAKAAINDICKISSVDKGIYCTLPPPININSAIKIEDVNKIPAITNAISNHQAHIRPWL